jgi:hypothetical protein
MNSNRLRYLVNLLFPLLVFSGALVFFMFTGPGDVSWLDGAHYQRRVALTEVGEGPWDQPLYVLAAQPFLLIPSGTLPQRASLASAIFAAGACLFLYLLLKVLLGVAPQFIARRVGILTAITLGVSHTFWLRAVTPGPEVLDALLLSAILYCLVRFANDGIRGYFYAAMLVYGLSLSNNLMMIFLFPFIAIWARVIKPPLVRDIGVVRFRGLLLFLAGSALALAVTAWGWSVAGFHVPAEQMSWLAFWNHMTVSWDAPLQQSLIRFTAMLFYNFPPWIAILGLLGLIELFRRQKYVFGLVFPLLLVYTFLVITLALSDPIPAYLPTWVFLSIAVGYGWWKILAESTWVGFVVALLLSLSPLLLYRFATTAVEQLGEQVQIQTLLSIPFETPLDSLDYYLNPDRRGLPSARISAQELLNVLPDPARVATPSWAGQLVFAPARYLAEVEEARPGLTVSAVGPNQSEELNQWATSPDTPLYLVGLHPPNPSVESLLDYYDLIPTGPLFQVQGRPATPSNTIYDPDQLPILAGAWVGFIRPQGYRLSFSIQGDSDETYSGRAILNPGATRPFEGSFNRISLIGESVLGRITYDDRIHVHIDAQVAGDRMEGTWQIFEAQELTGRFTAWKQP